jgi:hypothetical protein
MPQGCVLKINVVLYGLKYSDRLFYKDLSSRPKRYGYKEKKIDECVFHSTNFDKNIDRYIEDRIIIGVKNLFLINKSRVQYKRMRQTYKNP